MKKQTTTTKGSVNKRANSKPLSEAVFASTISALREFMNSTFTTKEDFLKLAVEFANLEEKVGTKFEKLDESNRAYRDQIITKIDKMLKKQDDLDEENAASTLHFERNDKTISNHEKRLTKLELAKN